MRLRVPMIPAKSWKPLLTVVNLYNGSIYFNKTVTPDLVLGGLVYFHEVYDTYLTGDCLLTTNGSVITPIPLSRFSFHDQLKETNTIHTKEDYENDRLLSTIMDLREYARKISSPTLIFSSNRVI